MTKKTDGENGADNGADKTPKPTPAAKALERPSMGGSYTRATDGSLIKQEG